MTVRPYDCKNLYQKINVKPIPEFTFQKNGHFVDLAYLVNHFFIHIKKTKKE